MSRSTLRTASPLRWARLAVVPLAFGALAACAPIETDHTYAPSDGIDVTLSDGVRGINLLVVSAAEGDPGRLLGAFTNQTGEDATVTVDVQDGRPLRVPVGAGETVNLSERDDIDAQFARIDAPPGALVTLSLDAGGGDQSVQVPVLDGALPEYAPYIPEARATE